MSECAKVWPEVKLGSQSQSHLCKISSVCSLPQKSCSIMYIGEPADIGSFLAALPVQNLSENCELFLMRSCLSFLEPQMLNIVQQQARILDTPSATGFDCLTMEIANAAQSEFLAFVNKPLALTQISETIVNMEKTSLNFVSIPKNNVIILKRQPLLQAGNLEKLLSQPTPQPIQPQQPKEKHWNTYETFRNGFGHVLKVSDRNEMLKLLPQNSIVAEVGVFKGDFSEKIINITKPAQLHLIDAWPDQMIRSSGEYINGVDAYKFTQNRFINEIGLGKVMLHRAFSTQITQKFPDEYFDWIYIDAGHDYQSVRDDLKTWYPKVKTGGFISGHDFIQKQCYGVVEAVCEFIKQKSTTLIALTSEQHGTRSWILKKQ